MPQTRFSAYARYKPRRNFDAVGRHVHLRQRQANRTYRGRVLRQRDPRHARRIRRRRISRITGGAGGIGRAIAERLLADDTCVVLLDNDTDALARTADEFAAKFGKDRIRVIRCDVTDEASVVRAFAFTAREYGGVDIVVSNAGIASAAPFDQTTIETWRRNMDVLGTGYFLVGREAAKILKAQGTGGSIVFIASKNALV